MTETFTQVEADVRTLVAGVRDDPKGRVRLREAFYQTYGDVAGWPGGFGKSELDFLRWEVRRGVLDPAAGSSWWRSVNLDFIYFSELAGRLQQLDVTLAAGLPVPVQLWLHYFRKPSALTWYRAHNGSVVQGYINYADLAAKESEAERTFLNIVLYRVLFAQALIEDRGFIIAEPAHLIANPLSSTVDILVHVPSFYPDHYPLSKEEIRDVLHLSFTLEGLGAAFVDEVIIFPRLVHLYRKAARWLQQPALESFVKDGRPVYPVAGSL